MNKKTFYYLCFFLASAFVLRLVLLHLVWINPDEGAHLMDGRLILDGYTPIVDYEARQPFYIFMIAVFLKIFGPSFLYARLLPVLASLGTGVVLFYIGRRLFNEAVGLVACAIYLFLPLILIWSPVVKTEPLTIFLASAGLLFMLKSYSPSIEKPSWMLLSGICAALAYYVRASALLIPLIIVVYLLFHRDSQPKRFRTRFFLFVLGYVVICLLMGAVFISSLSFREILTSQINPLDTVVYRILHVFDMLPAAERIVEGSGFRILDQNVHYTLVAWRQGLLASLFLFAGGILAFVHFFTHRLKHRANAYLLLGLWTGFILVPYIYQSAFRGFFPQYIVEVLPPLALLTASVSHRLVLKMSLTPQKILAVLAVFGLLFVLQKALWDYYPGLSWVIVVSALLSGAVLFRKAANIYAVLFIVVIAGLTGVFFEFFEGLQINRVLAVCLMFAIFSAAITLIALIKWKRLFIKPNSIILITAFYMTALYSGFLLGPSFPGVWPPSVLKRAVKFLKQTGERSDTVLSGGMIWTFESGFFPFLDVSHPTQFLLKEWPDFEKQFTQKQPEYIIKERYTERKFTHYWDFIETQIDSSYSLLTSIPAPSGTVEIYKRKNPLPIIDID